MSLLRASAFALWAPLLASSTARAKCGLEEQFHPSAKVLLWAVGSKMVAIPAGTEVRLSDCAHERQQRAQHAIAIKRLWRDITLGPVTFAEGTALQQWYGQVTGTVRADVAVGSLVLSSRWPISVFCEKAACLPSAGRLAQELSHEGHGWPAGTKVLLTNGQLTAAYGKPVSWWPWVGERQVNYPVGPNIGGWLECDEPSEGHFDECYEAEGVLRIGTADLHMRDAELIGGVLKGRLERKTPLFSRVWPEETFVILDLSIEQPKIALRLPGDPDASTNSCQWCFDGCGGASEKAYLTDGTPLECSQRKR